MMSRALWVRDGDSRLSRVDSLNVSLPRSRLRRTEVFSLEAGRCPPPKCGPCGLTKDTSVHLAVVLKLSLESLDQGAPEQGLGSPVVWPSLHGEEGHAPVCGALQSPRSSATRCK